MTREYFWKELFGYLACMEREWRYVEIFIWEKGMVSVDLLWMFGILALLLFLSAVKRRF